MAPDAAEDEARWEEARSILDRAPTESAERRLRRWRTLRLLLLVAVLVLLTAVAVVVVVIVRSAGRASPPPPTSQEVVGLVIGGAGLLLMITGLVVLVGGIRRLGAWPSPLAVLTRQQRKDLLAQVRGTRPVDPAHLGLARHMAELLRLNRRGPLVLNAGLLLNFVGQWITRPAVFRAVLALAFAVVLAVALPWGLRDARRARRFLDRTA